MRAASPVLLQPTMYEKESVSLFTICVRTSSLPMEAVSGRESDLTVERARTYERLVVSAVVAREPLLTICAGIEEPKEPVDACPCTSRRPPRLADAFLLILRDAEPADDPLRRLVSLLFESLCPRTSPSSGLSSELLCSLKWGLTCSCAVSFTSRVAPCLTAVLHCSMSGRGMCLMASRTSSMAVGFSVPPLSTSMTMQVRPWAMTAMARPR
mmetsp:Transcript_64395/g.168554  ORF Transcript_64395/g.168554 Transcript_64395/m.168554 type:complete len:212 (-) Transcript_64395:179-814(-)